MRINDGRVVPNFIGRSKIVFKDLPVDDPKQRRPDIGKAREFWSGSRRLGWS